MADPRTQFTLNDSEGNPHKYEIAFLQPATALPIALEIMAMGAGPIMAVIKASAELEGDAESVDKYISALDFSTVGDDLKKSLVSLQKRPDIVRALFNDALRDGKALSQDFVYNEAYAGNWAEWMKAIHAIIKANGFLAFFDSSTTTPSE